MIIELSEHQMDAVAEMAEEGWAIVTLGSGMQVRSGKYVETDTAERLFENGVIVSIDQPLLGEVIGQSVRLSEEMKVNFDKLTACDGKRCGRKNACVRFLIGRRTGGVIAGANPKDCDKFVTIGGK